MKNLKLFLENSILNIEGNIKAIDENILKLKYFKDGETGINTINQLEEEVSKLAGKEEVLNRQSYMKEFFNDDCWSFGFAYKRKSDANLIIRNGNKLYTVNATSKYPNITNIRQSPENSKLELSINVMSRNGYKSYNFYKLDINDWTKPIKEIFDVILTEVKNK